MGAPEIGALGTAIAAIIGAVLGSRRTRRSKPDMAAIQVGYLERINDRLNQRVDDLEEELRAERVEKRELRVDLEDARREVDDLRSRVERLENGGV